MLQNLFLNIDAGTIDWSRAQFALTAIYHWLFVPLTLGLAVIMGIVETKYYRTKLAFEKGLVDDTAVVDFEKSQVDDKSVVNFWKDAAKFWQRLFGVNFAMGVATGIILEFEFGTNWSNYSWFVGDIFGAPLAVEGIVAFFMESTFVAVMFFGWKKVSPGFHLASTWLTGLGATISAWWILVANAWMQYPVGCEFNPDTMRNEMVSFAQVALSPFAVSKFCHTVTSAWIIGAIFCVGVCSWYLLKKRETKLAVESMKIGATVGLVACLLALITGHKSAQDVAEVQPMKLAAMEALYNGGTDVGLTAIAWVNPFCQPDYEVEDEAPLKIEMPNALSFMATNDIHGYVPGINDILNGYTTPDGKVEPSIDEKIERGKQAIAALAAYRKLSEKLRVKSERLRVGDGTSGMEFAAAIPATEPTGTAAADSSEPTGTAAADSSLFTLHSSLKTLKENMKYFGYGYIRDKSEVVPFIPVNFWAFRIMVGLGCLFILFFALIVVLAYKIPFLTVFTRRLLATFGLLPETEADSYDITRLPAWHYWVAIVLIPLGYIASESGWLVAEFGRQPWTIQDMLPTWAAVSNLQASSVALTFVLFLVLFTTMLAVEISILLRQIKKGPDTLDN